METPGLLRVRRGSKANVAETVQTKQEESITRERDSGVGRSRGSSIFRDSADFQRLGVDDQHGGHYTDIPAPAVPSVPPLIDLLPENQEAAGSNTIAQESDSHEQTVIPTGETNSLRCSTDLSDVSVRPGVKLSSSSDEGASNSDGSLSSLDAEEGIQNSCTAENGSVGQSGPEDVANSGACVQNNPIDNLTVDGIAKGLIYLNLEQFATQFKLDKVDGTLLKDYNKEDLMQKYNMDKPQAIKILKYFVHGWQPSE